MRRFITGTTTTYMRHYDDDADNDDDTNEYCNTATATRVHLLVLLVLASLDTRSFEAQNTMPGHGKGHGGGGGGGGSGGARAGRDGGRVVERSPGGTAPRGGTGDVDSVQAEEAEECHTRRDHADRREDFAGRPVTVTDDFHRRAGVCKPALPAAARPRTWLAGGHGSGNGLAAKVEDLAEQVGLGRTPAPPGTGDGGDAIRRAGGGWSEPAHGGEAQASAKRAHGLRRHRGVTYQTIPRTMAPS